MHFSFSFGAPCLSLSCPAGDSPPSPCAFGVSARGPPDPCGSRGVRTLPAFCSQQTCCFQTHHSLVEPLRYPCYTNSKGVQKSTSSDELQHELRSYPGNPSGYQQTVDSPFLTKHFSHHPTQHQTWILHPGLTVKALLSEVFSQKVASWRRGRGPALLLALPPLSREHPATCRRKWNRALSGCNNLISPSQKIVRTNWKILSVYVPISKGPKNLYESIIFLSEN